MKASKVLKSLREQKRVSLATVRQETKISMSYLEAMEEGRWNIFPAEIYLLGFLKKYASYLGLNPEDVVTLYKKELQPVLPEKEPVAEELHPGSSGVSSHQRSVKATLVLFILGLLSLGIWWLYAVLSVKPQEKQVLNLLRIKGFPPRSAFVQNEQLRLQVKAVAPVWLRVIGDQSLAFEGFLSSGSVRTWEGKKEIILRIGNVNNVFVTLNGANLNPRAGAVQDVNEIVLKSPVPQK